MIYFDSSALVKRYVEETGTNSVKSILSTGGEIATSKLTYPEILSALMRKHRAGEIAKKLLQDIVARFEKDWYHILVLEFHNDLLQAVKFLLEKHPLKAADAVHLSSALWLKQTTRADLTFVTSDSNLLRAAQEENLHILNPLDGQK
jgi:predicted nucleic acid-binding protein